MNIKNKTKTMKCKNGKPGTYKNDKVLEVKKDTLTKLPCWLKYKSYTATNNVPVLARGVVEAQ